MSLTNSLFGRLSFLLRNPWSRIWLGMPAVAFVIAAGWIAASYGMVANAPKADAVIKQARAELANQKLDSARIILERYLNNSGDTDDVYNNDPEVLHNYAAILLALNQVDRGLAIFRRLAPENSVGHIPSQLAICQLIMRQPNVSTAELNQAEARIKRILDEKPNNSEAMSMMVELHVRNASAIAPNESNARERQRDHLRQAADILARLAADRRPWLGQKLGELYILLGESINADRWFQAAGKYFQDLAEAKVDDHASRVAWAQAEVGRRRFDEAHQILAQGLSTVQTGAPAVKGETTEDNRKRQQGMIGEYQLLMAQVRAGQVEYLKATSPTNLKERTAKISDGLRYNPANEVLLRNMIELSQSEGPAAQEMAAQLKQLQVDGNNNSALQFALGVDAFVKNRKEQAQFHFERALKIDPSAPIVANNLAFLLVQKPDPDLPRARALIDAALERHPTNIEFIDTRGIVRIKQGEYKEGIADLERVSEIKGPNLNRHEMLAVAYSKIGDQETADLHLKSAAALKAKQPQPQPAPNLDGSTLGAALADPNLKASSNPNPNAAKAAPKPASAPTSKKASPTPAPTSGKKAASPKAASGSGL